MDYNAAFLCEEEFQVLSNPPEIARHMPVELQRLLGYDVFAGALNYFGDFQHPIESFDLEPIDWARADGEAQESHAVAQASKL